MAAPMVSSSQLAQALDRYFNSAELRELCHDLGVEYENLGGKSKSEKALELIQYCERHGRTDDLINTIQRARPNVDWGTSDPAQQDPSQKGSEFGSTKVSGRPYQQTIQPEGNVSAENVESASTGSEDAISGAENDAGSVINLSATMTARSSTPDDAELSLENEPVPNPFQTITTHNGTLLTERHGVRIYGLVTRRPWNLPVDAFVLPLGFGREYSPGLLARDLEEALASVQADSPYKAFAQTVNTRTPPELLPTAPFILMHNDTDFWTVPGTERKVIAATANDGHGRTIANAAAAAAAIMRLAIANGLRRLTIPALGAGTGGLPEQGVALALVDAILAAIPSRSPADPARLDEIIFTTIKPEVLAALRQRFFKRPQAAVNDEPVGRDLLQVETAVYALAEMCMLNDQEPPLAVGILGGWGSGKSFVLHLMQERIAQLRRLPVPAPNSPQANQFFYIGHVYQITFDAWTYAKSNLWASLMQTIFVELNDQLTREREIAKKLVGVQTDESEEDRQKIAQKLREDNPLWQLIAYPKLRRRNTQELILYAPELEKALKGKSPDVVRDEAEKWLRGQDTAGGQGAVEIKHDHLWTELRKLKKEEREQLRQKEKELADAQQKLEQARIEANKQVTQEIEEESKELAWKSVQNLARQQFGLAYRHIEQQFTRDENEKPLIQTVWYGAKSWVFMILNNPLEFVLFLLLAVLLAAFAQSNAFLDALVLPDWILAAGAVIAGWARSYSRWTNLIQDSFGLYQKQLESERERLQETHQERLDKLMARQKAAYAARLQNSQTQPGELADPHSVPAMEDRVTKLEAEAKFLRYRVGMTAGFVSLLDFVTSRLDDAVYEKELGLMHQVQRDLQELSDSLTADNTVENLFPRGKPRIILYIDDLDRCPPLRVVEVLEAVQLLLKTDLFIVVLAIDVRFITRALETVYKGILARRGSPSGLDYIEKIIQIPYRVQPIEDEAIAGYLARQVLVETPPPPAGAGSEDSGRVGTAVGAGDAPPAGELPGEGTQPVEPGQTEGEAGQVEWGLTIEAIELSSGEYTQMQTCCRQIAMTPRAVKRLANVYKLLKIIWYRERHEPDSLEMIEVIMAMLALSERYPHQVRDLFEGISQQIRAQSPQKLKAYIQERQPEEERDTYTAQEWQQLEADTAVLLPDISFNQIDLKTFNRVRSFCFVGDIGYDPGDMMPAVATPQLAKTPPPPLQG